MDHSKSIEIVSHVWDAPGGEQYAQMARLQFASLYSNRPSYPVTYSLCYEPSNGSVLQAIQWIQAFFAREGTLHNLAVQTVAFPAEYLFRRAVGRNFCAKRTRADTVWFTDVDYYFGPGAIDAACELTTPDTQLVMPQQVQIHQDHQTGDDDLAAQRNVALPVIEREHFLPRRIRVAIGGLQIVGGNTARRLGYLDGTKWVQAVDPEQGFRSCACDRAFRRHNQFETQRLPIPEVYRLRHTQDGRDRDQRGTVRGKEVW